MTLCRSTRLSVLDVSLSLTMLTPTEFRAKSVDLRAKAQLHGRRLSPQMLGHGAPHGTNWIVEPTQATPQSKPSRGLLVGPHPGGNTAEIRARLQELLAVGVDVFVCLQEEMPSHATGALASKHANRRTAYGHRVLRPAKLYMQIAQECCRPDVQLTYLHLPVPPDGDGVITDELLKPFLGEVLGYIRSGSVAYVHCDSGEGRSGTFATIAYALLEGKGSNEAIDRTQIMRNQRLGFSRSSFIELPSQKVQVHRVLADKSWCGRAVSQAPPARALALTRGSSSGGSMGSTASAGSGADRMAISTLHERIREHWAQSGASSYSALVAAMRGLSVTEGALNVRFGDMALCFGRAGVPMTPDEVRVLANFHETTTNSAICDGHAVLGAICGKLAPWRVQIVDACWSQVQEAMYSGGVRDVALASESISVHDLVNNVYDAEAHPRVESGLATREQLRGDVTAVLRALFPSMRVDRARFLLWIGLTSASLVDDAQFEDLLWRLYRLRACRQRVTRLSEASTASTARPRSALALVPSSPMPRSGQRTASQGAARGAAIARRILHQLTFARIADNRMISRGVRALVAFEANLRDAAQQGTHVHMRNVIVVLKQCSVMFTDSDISEIHAAFGTGRDTIDGKALVAALIGRLPPARWQLVGQAFNAIDAGGTGYITLNEFFRRCVRFRVSVCLFLFVLFLFYCSFLSFLAQRARRARVRSFYISPTHTTSPSCRFLPRRPSSGTPRTNIRRSWPAASTRRRRVTTSSGRLRRKAASPRRTRKSRCSTCWTTIPASAP